MSQQPSRHEPRATSEEADVAPIPQPRPADRHRPARPVRPRKPADQPDGDSAPNPDDPDSEFEVAGDEDLGPADLGPLAPGTSDPDADSGRIRRI